MGGKEKMKYIQVDFQEAFNHFVENIVPYKFQADSLDELLEWFDRWLDWLVGSPGIEGNDIMYLYEYWQPGETRLELFDIDFRIVDENGDEVE
jgi:hypothetical protein